MMGGVSPVGDMSMAMPMKDSLSQGTQYLNIHKSQYGGNFGKYPDAVVQTNLTKGGGLGPYPGAVVQGSLINAQAGGAVGPYPASVVASTLPVNMVPSARTGPLDAAIASIQGMHDGGGRSKKRSNKRRSNKRRSYNKKRRSIKHRGGSHYVLSPSPVDADPMLLPAGMEKQASLNYEWSMAKDPSAFLPKAT
jgi:hypothetical protein